jgi:hypothetical protein
VEVAEVVAQLNQTLLELLALVLLHILELQVLYLKMATHQVATVGNLYLRMVRMEVLVLPPPQESMVAEVLAVAGMVVTYTAMDLMVVLDMPE